ncbi:hypothetical protein J2Z48_001889 [Croceifilum oryzae]|uniref:Methyltransferase domain-containing protein n=1 Tax=Croceifilum oryzae TaxID=1553429 RepID=A0AAJ1WU73_9BACL|nr:class I SAM-dependent methyltransferase [Croceifilum oryzae]MDQ0417716.1 hypothetical protein [Croceifilum oryzae]
MSRLREYFFSNNNHLVDKWDHYLEIYERHFSRFVNKKINVLEIGIYHGGSLQMWKNYFGPQATIYGLDIYEKCKELVEERVNIIIGDQGDRNFWKQIKPHLPKFDIIIDDGGHHMHQQKITFEEMFSEVSPNGVYVIEDMHTSYLTPYGGGKNSKENFINYTKNIVDSLYGWHNEDVDQFTTSIGSMTYYDSVLVIEKEPRQKPFTIKSGVPTMTFT